MGEFFNRVYVLVPTTGQGTVTFGSAVSDAFLTPAEADAADSDEPYYLFEEGTDIEIGKGTVGGSVTTLARTTVLKSKIGGSVGTDKMDLQGNATLRFVAPAEALALFLTASDVREVLTANRTYYVRTDGNDGNNGLTNNSGGAFLTIAKAMEVLGTIDANGKTVTVQVGAGTWNLSSIKLVNVVGIAAPSHLIIIGDETTPSNVTINASGFAAFYATGLYTPWSIRGFRITATSNAIVAAEGSYVLFQNIDFGAAGANHLNSLKSYIRASGNYSISGNAVAHWSASRLGAIEVFNRTVTLSGTPAFSSAFANASDIGYMFVSSNTFSGTGATGTRYSSVRNSLINTSGGGATYLPGDSSGSTSTGGLYN